MHTTDIQKLDKKILEVIPEDKWVTTGRIENFIENSFRGENNHAEDEDLFPDMPFNEEGISFRCGVLVAQGKLEFETVERYTGSV